MVDKNNGLIDFSDTSSVNEAMTLNSSNVNKFGTEKKISVWIILLLLGLIFAIFLGVVLFFDTYSLSHYEPVNVSFFNDVIEIRNEKLSDLKESGNVFNNVSDNFELTDEYIELKVNSMTQLVPYETHISTYDSMKNSVEIYYFNDRAVYYFTGNYNEGTPVIQELYSDKDYVYVSEDFYTGVSFLNHNSIKEKVNFSYKNYVRVPRDMVATYLESYDGSLSFLNCEEFYSLCNDYFSCFESSCLTGVDSLYISLNNLKEDIPKFKRAMESYNKTEIKSGVNPAKSYVDLISYFIRNFENVNSDNEINDNGDMQSLTLYNSFGSDDSQDDRKELNKLITDIKGAVENAKSADYSVDSVMTLYNLVVDFIESDIFYTSYVYSLYIGNFKNHSILSHDVRFNGILSGTYDYDVGEVTYNDYLMLLIPDLNMETLLELDEIK